MNKYFEEISETEVPFHLKWENFECKQKKKKRITREYFSKRQILNPDI